MSISRHPGASLGREELRQRGEAVFTFVITSYVTVLPLTAITLRLLRVPEHLELVAGSLLVVAYGMLGGALISAIV